MCGALRGPCREGQRNEWSKSSRRTIEGKNGERGRRREVGRYAGTEETRKEWSSRRTEGRIESERDRTTEEWKAETELR